MDTVFEVPKSMPSTRMASPYLPPTGSRHTPGVIGNRFAYLDAPAPLAFAHRGGAAQGDENTTDAFARAVAAGYRYIETDVHASADGVAVTFHDETLARMAGRPERIRDLPWAELAPLGIPRLDEVLAAWPQVRFNIDVKHDTGVDPTIEVVRRTGALERVLLTSFSDTRTARMRAALGPDLATSPGTAGVARLWTASRSGRGARRLAARYAAAQVPVRQGPVRVVDVRFVRYAHRVGLQVHVWTIDAPDQMNELLDLGVDGIMTDRIDVLRDVYTQRGCWTGGAS
jgi:glycerophosphoryl diester phosphodiesterase